MIPCQNAEMFHFHLSVSIYVNIQLIHLTGYFIIQSINVTKISILSIELSGTLLLVLQYGLVPFPSKDL